MKKSLLLLTVLLTLACQKKIESEPATPPTNQLQKDCSAGEFDDFNIVNGKTVKHGHWIEKSTVMLLSKTVDGKSGLCTGVIIANNMILTAAHCVSGNHENLNPEQGKVEGTIVFSPNMACDPNYTKKSSLRYFKSVRVHPNYSKHNKTPKDRFDVAVIKIHDEIPYGFQKTNLMNGKAFSELKKSNAFLLSAGFGNTQGYKIEDTVFPRLRVFSYASPPSFSDNNDLILDQSKGGVCTGDSGGPLFVRLKGQNYLLGIHSGVVNYNGDNECSGISIIMNVHWHRPFIRKTMNEI